MSSSIWTRCAGDSEVGPLRLEPWRVVEGQHQVSTRKLVATDAEQALLEDLIEGVKPRDLSRGRLHYLLATPFRYPPLRHGSRFGARHEPGIWYGSETIDAAFAEVAYYRLLFFEGTAADLDGLETELTAFRARVRTERGVDLVSGCFAEWRSDIASPTSYAATQALGADLRVARVQAFRYPSARHPDGVGIAVLERKAFARYKPHGLESWHCIASRAVVEMRKRDYFERRAFSYAREAFLVEGELPAPAL
ncbi:MAG TPA: RES family NAD+ phosphorylase [Longimicrobiales bacterium]|nr:RES family NAD+ phosphorylase [Longimicrobiales bacterium]